MGALRTTFRDPESGRWTRVCCECRQTKDLEHDFYKARRIAMGTPKDWNYQCKKCKTAQLQELTRRQRADPQRGPELRAMYARLRREWRARNPDKERANRDRYWARLRKDPERYTRALENRRIEYRLRAEREGRSVRALSTAKMGREHLPKLPAKPLSELLDVLVTQYDGDTEALGRALNFSSRNLRAWRTGEREEVQFDVADRILTAAGLMWWEVWTEDEYPELHMRLAA